MRRDDGELALMVGGRALSGWTDIRMTRSLERIPNDFDLLVTERYPGEADRVFAEPGSPCLVKIGDDVVLTGYVDRYMPSISADGHQVRVSGRGRCQDLVDCAAWLPDAAGQVNFGTVAAVARRLAEPFGIEVKAPDGDGLVVPKFNIILTETGWEIIDRLARYSSMLAYEDATGALVLADLGTDSMSGGAVQGINVEGMSAVMAMDQRFSLYKVVLMAIDTVSDVNQAVGGPNDYNTRAEVTDDQVGRFRPKVLLAEATQTLSNIALRRANWEKARRYGRSQIVRVTLDTWRDAAGRLWEPNTLLSVHLPAIKVENQRWLIAEVTYRRDKDGTHADLVLMPPEAFAPEPVILQPFDWQVAQALRTALNRDSITPAGGLQ